MNSSYYIFSPNGEFIQSYNEALEDSLKWAKCCASQCNGYIMRVVTEGKERISSEFVWGITPETASLVDD